CAVQAQRPLYAYFAAMAGRKLTHLPRMTINLFSGGKHAGGQVSIQDVLVVPAGAKTIDDGLAMTYAVFQAAAKLIAQRFNIRTLRADEGGLAPPCKSPEELIATAVEAITAAGLKPGSDVALAIDVASSHFYSGEQGGRYALHTDPAAKPKPLTPAGMIETLVGWAEQWPIVSLEDGLAEEDWAHWPTLRAALQKPAAGRGPVLCLGDDFLCTNPARIERAQTVKPGPACDALLLKVNQIGTLTEALRARDLAANAGWKVTVSARSGETEDDWLADLAVGWGADQIKIGSITQSERLAKYNRLLAIEKETGLPVTGWPGRS
ncbi:MAG TPA: phosphopyruvate hydratase, partial [Planctomycetota bacterium]|nr:phosphopyruvate hydratase [Planctomycetota bacterium]